MAHKLPADPTSEAVDTARARLQIFLDNQYATAVRYAQRYFDNREDAEDAVSEAMFRAVRAAHLFNPSKNFDAWITHIIKMVCLEMLRARGAKKVPRMATGEAHSVRGEALDSIALLEAQIDPRTDVERGVLESPMQGCLIEGVFVSPTVAHALLMLDPVSRQLVVKLYMESSPLSQAEAAIMLGLTESQVKVMAKDARNRLSALLLSARGRS